MEQHQIRYGLYARVSTAKQGGRYASISSQFERLKGYVSDQENSIYATFEDKGVSGMKEDRTGYQDLVEGIKHGLFDKVLCTEVSRISRSVVLFEKFLALCDKYGVEFLCLDGGMGTGTAKGRSLLHVYSVLAQVEREQTSMRTSVNMESRSRRGLFNGGYIYGYRPDPKQKGHLNIDEKEAKLIRLMFSRYLEWKSYCRVASWLTKQGFKTRAFTSREGKLRKAGPWSKSKVLYVLRNPAYIGIKSVGGKMVPAIWDAIIEKETWHSVQKMLDKQHVPQKEGGEKHTYLLTGLVRCSHCGVTLENGSGTGFQGKKLYFYYRHPPKKRVFDCPHSANIPAEDLESMVTLQMLRMMDQKGLLDDFTQDVATKLKEDAELKKKSLENIEEEIQSNRIRKNCGLPHYLEKPWIKKFFLFTIRKMLQQGAPLEERKKDFTSLVLKEGISAMEILDIVWTMTERYRQVGEIHEKLAHILIKKVDLFPKKIIVTLSD